MPFFSSENYHQNKNVSSTKALLIPSSIESWSKQYDLSYENEIRISIESEFINLLRLFQEFSSRFSEKKRSNSFFAFLLSINLLKNHSDREKSYLL